MTAVTFDTLKWSKRLIDAGVVPTQAEAHVEAFAEIVSAELATKADIRMLKTAMTTNSKDLENRLVHKLSKLMITAITLSTAVLGILYQTP